MDLTSLLGAFMGDEALTSIGTASDTSAGDVASVLSAALPSLIAGANAQAYNEETAESFANALNQHSKDDVNDIAAFVNNVDVKDGKKVVQHLLGDQTKETTDEIAAATGVSKAKTGTILAIAAPLLLSLLSGNSNQNTTSSATSLLGSLLGGGLGGNSNGLGAGAVMAMAAPLLLNMLNNKPAQTTAANQTLQAANPAPAVDTSGAPSLLGSLLSGLGGTTATQQTQQQASGSLLGSLLGGSTAAQQPQQQAGGSLLGSLLGGNTATQQQPVQQQTEQQSSGGLLSGLLGLLK